MIWYWFICFTYVIFIGGNC